MNAVCNILSPVYQVMFRTGVSTTAPEGLRWTSITVPPGCEVNQISVGPTGLTWAVLWNGRALVRAGVTRENPTGNIQWNYPVLSCS
jgi:tectonin beta-propeller repeat-containing protein 1